MWLCACVFVRASCRFVRVFVRSFVSGFVGSFVPSLVRVIACLFV